jgi:hypothetical protein
VTGGPTLREYVGSTLVGTGTGTFNTTANTVGTWQQIQLSYQVASPGSTLDLNVYQTSQPVGSNVQIDDVTASSG